MTDRIRIDPSVQLAWGMANGEAWVHGSPEIQPLHFLVAVLTFLSDFDLEDARALQLPDQAVHEIGEFINFGRTRLNASTETIERVRTTLSAPAQERPAGEMRTLHRSAESRELFVRAGQRARALGASALTLDVVFEELVVTLGDKIAQHFPDCRPIAAKNRDRWSSVSQISDWQTVDPQSEAKSRRLPRAMRDGGRDLTALAEAGRLSPVVGRRREIKGVARFLARTRKRSVMLVGAPGVGKTAIVEGLAQAAVRPGAAEPLRGLHIVELSVTNLLTDTQHRGDLERRINDIIAYAAQHPEFIWFIDEIHRLVSGQGSDLPNMLKAALARDEIRCIGATTIEEFEQHLRPDAAFLRRFQIVQVDPPSPTEAETILRSWTGRIEEVQHVTFDDGAIPVAVQLARQHFRDRALPDSALDLLENAATLVTVSSLSSHGTISKTPRVIDEAALDLTLREVYGIVPLPRGPDLAAVRRELGDALVGQDRAMDEFIDAVAGHADRETTADRRPLVVMLAGSTGVGKTFAAETIGRLLYGDAEETVFRINMNEFEDAHEIGRLTGAPPGFVGHDVPSALFLFARHTARGLILLDEIEKAHPAVRQYFLEVFDRGVARDQRGREVDFARFVFVLTTNLGFHQRPAVGFEQNAAPAETRNRRQRLERELSPEFMGRVDRLVEFRDLDPDDLLQLFTQSMSRLSDDMARRHQVKLLIPNPVLDQLFGLWTPPARNGRELTRWFSARVATPVGERAAAEPGATLRVAVRDGRVVLIAG